MKVKQQPEDFQVEERTDVVPGKEGSYALYRMTKRGWTTHDALGVVRRRWKIDRQRVGYGGLKDRHALTRQYFTILRGPARRMEQQGIVVEYLGQVRQPYSSRDIQANVFQLVVRNLNDRQVDDALAALEQVQQDGLPNYFDDQRFGSVSGDGQFVAKYMVLGRHEEALKLALAAHYEHERSEQKKEKAILRQHWGDWPKCKELLARSHARSLVDYLVHHPQDFRGTLERLNPDLRSLYLSAYQSYLWNKLLAQWIQEHFAGEKLLRIELRQGKLPVPVCIEEEKKKQLVSLQMPLPSGRMNRESPTEISTMLNSILAEEGITADQFKLRGFKKMFFSRGERAAWCFPGQVKSHPEMDDLHASRKKLELAFELPRGSYATLVIKRLVGK